MEGPSAARAPLRDPPAGGAQRDPPPLNDFISLQKDTALVSVLGAIEANRAAQIYSETTFNYSSYLAADRARRFLRRITEAGRL